MKFIETSAKSAFNVDEAFTTMTREIITLKKKSVEQDESKKKNNLSLTGDTKIIHNKNKKCC